MEEHPKFWLSSLNSISREHKNQGRIWGELRWKNYDSLPSQILSDFIFWGLIAPLCCEKCSDENEKVLCRIKETKGSRKRKLNGKEGSVTIQDFFWTKYFFDFFWQQNCFWDLVFEIHLPWGESTDTNAYLQAKLKVSVFKNGQFSGRLNFNKKNVFLLRLIWLGGGNFFLPKFTQKNFYWWFLVEKIFPHQAKWNVVLVRKKRQRG